jgi:TrmH family RNA methyltransferase
MPISSQSNRTIKLIRSLRNRKDRERAGLFFVEGIRIVGEAAQLGADIQELVVAPQLLTSPFGREIVEAQKRAGVACLEVTAEVFKRFSLKEGPPGIGALVRPRWDPLETVSLSSELGWVALDAVQDPGNLGSILRTSDAVGGAGVILIEHTTDPYDPAAVRASMGAIFSQRLVRSSLAQFADWKRRHQVFVVGTSGSASTDYQVIAYRPPLVLFMGSERLGLSDEQQALCDVMVSIPMLGRSDSLNLAVATSLVLYEIFNQRRAAVKHGA